MAIVTVADYNRREEEAVQYLPDLIIEAFNPLVFGQTGYPTRVVLDSAVDRCCDGMHASRFDNWIDQRLEGITYEEFALLRELLVKTEEFSRQTFGRVRVPRGAALHALQVLRHIKFLYTDTRPRIFEFGPGAGYLGALLILAGYPYAATDITQSFYLFQSRLWDYMSGGRLREGALGGPPEETLGGADAGIPAHVPWWQIADLGPESIPAFDVVTGNHCVAEMHDHSLRYNLLLSEAALRQSRASRQVFLIEGWGLSDAGKRAVVNKRFYEFGFALAHHDAFISVFTLQSSPEVTGTLLYNLESDGYPLIAHADPRSPISLAITTGRQKTAPLKQIDKSKLEELYTSILGTEDHLTPSEKFWKRIKFQVWCDTIVP